MRATAPVPPQSYVLTTAGSSGGAMTRPAPGVTPPRGYLIREDYAGSAPGVSSCFGAFLCGGPPWMGQKSWYRHTTSTHDDDATFFRTPHCWWRLL